MHIDQDYIIALRHELHQVPETGTSLPKTFAIIKRELDALGIPYTEKWSECSIVATLNEGGGHKTIGIRADNDGLPVQEETGLPFASTHEGKMHACGHDCHTAMVLGTAKALKEMEKELKCCVKFVFQGPEEGPSGAKMLCENGLMKEIDEIIGCHVKSSSPVGAVELNPGCMNASSRSFQITLRGKSCHVARPNLGIDAITMAARVYNDIQIMRAREMDPVKPVVIGIGTIHGGSAVNIVCDEVTLGGTIRALDAETDEKAFRRIREIAESVAKDMGGSAKVETLRFTPAVINHPKQACAVAEAARKVTDPALINDNGDFSMGAEDFSRFLMCKPGAFFKLGTMPEDGKSFSAHNGKFRVNDRALEVAPKIFVQYVLDNMED